MNVGRGLAVGLLTLLTGATPPSVAVETRPAAEVCTSDLPLLRVDLAGTLGVHGRLLPMEIERRGDSSFYYPKHQYRIELEEKRALLGMPAEDDWVLYGPYVDTTLMRNAFAFELAERIGVEAPAHRYVEVAVEDGSACGRNDGVYLLIAAPRPGRGSSFMVEVDRRGELRTSLGVPLDQHGKRGAAVYDAFARMEGALADGTFEDHADVDAFLGFALVQELTRNADGFRASVYLHDTPDGRIAPGPVWDFNIAFGGHHKLRGTEGWVMDEVPARALAWWGPILRDPDVAAQLARRWHQLRRGPLSDASLTRFVMRTRDKLAAAKRRDAARWDRDGGDAEALADWTVARAHWMDAEMASRFSEADDPMPTPLLAIHRAGRGIGYTLTREGRTLSSGTGKLRRRGSSSRSFPKPHYAVTLGREKYTLNGPYRDRSLLRNVVGYRLARTLGRYAPRTEFVEVVVDETPLGLFVLTEKITRRRLPIEKHGSFIARVDKIDGGDVLVRTRRGVDVQVRYPEDGSEDVRAAFDALESDVLAAIDVDAFVDYLILQELAANRDAYTSSTYYYKPRDGKITAGPLWDLNIGFTGPVTGWRPYPRIPWWRDLMRDCSFRQRVAARWRGLREAELSDAAIADVVTGAIEELSPDAVQRDMELWRDPQRDPTFDEAVAELRRWLRTRARWMDENMEGMTSCR